MNNTGQAAEEHGAPSPSLWPGEIGYCGLRRADYGKELAFNRQQKLEKKEEQLS